ncbi:hypothetical protein LR48_Vigan02g025700 [Vigna angularis]|uniref:Uncharacterized protein n=1 Tax=Phaseolus angularis TaxID=3914 RepID=A0A0L9TUP5_PHAAN|nr:hypothetical protein LR48_Vigan02g025700 [Vigna angularis]
MESRVSALERAFEENREETRANFQWFEDMMKDILQRLKNMERESDGSRGSVYGDRVGRREKDIIEEEGGDQDCDGNVVTLASQNEVAKVAGFSGDSVVGLGEYVKTVKEGEDKGKKAECGGNIVTITSGSKVKDEAVLSVDGSKVVGVGTENVFEVQNITGAAEVHLTINNMGKNAVKGFNTWQQKSHNLSLEDLATPKLRIVEGNKGNMLLETLAAVTQIGSVEILRERMAAVTRTGRGEKVIQEFKILVSLVNPTSENQLGEYFLTKWQALCKKDNKVGQSPFCLGLLICYGNRLLANSSNKLVDFGNRVRLFNKHLFGKDYVVKVRSYSRINPTAKRKP